MCPPGLLGSRGHWMYAGWGMSHPLAGRRGDSVRIPPPRLPQSLHFSPVTYNARSIYFKTAGTGHQPRQAVTLSGYLPRVRSGHSQPPGWEGTAARARPCAPAWELLLERPQSQTALQPCTQPSTGACHPQGGAGSPPKRGSIPPPSRRQTSVGEPPDATQPSHVGSGGGTS